MTSPGNCERQRVSSGSPYEQTIEIEAEAVLR